MEVLPMNKSRPVATETVKSLNYTKNILQTIPNNDTMEVVTRTNAVKSPTNSPKAPKLVYTVKEVAQMLAISQRAAYNLCNSTTEFRVLRAGGSIRIPKDSFDAWLYRAA
jgi:excisionase family DNA binding protein